MMKSLINFSAILVLGSLSVTNGYSTPSNKQSIVKKPVTVTSAATPTAPSRRSFLQKAVSTSFLVPSLLTAATTITSPQPANAIGPVKLKLQVKSYTAKICPPDRPIPGEKAMKGMKGLCVTVIADVLETSPKPLEKVGVYGFVIDSFSGESVLANNPDLSSDAGQFAMIESILPTTKSVEFEFIAAVPMETDLSKFQNGIGDLDFLSMRVVSFPGGQQYGAVNPCEMNEFSVECEAWEDENGEYVKQNYMIKSNDRTKGR
mmetsp:Transcript_28716/g.42575  ORF Transcript_28716/g.42575 Transcript_28716/m.42575 type:complete len:261 (-) Transcript_28716:148-930(-)